MSSFEELLEQAYQEPNYEQLKQQLSDIIERSRDCCSIVRFLEPFLRHVNSGNLVTFYTLMQQPENNKYAIPSAIHNVVNDCQTNRRLLQVLELLVHKFE